MFLFLFFCFRGKNSAAFNDEPRRRSGRKREDKSYVESPDIVIEEDYISKPSPAKKPNLGNGPVKEIGGLKEKEAEPVKKPGTNGIEMESDGEETEEENLPTVPTVQVRVLQYTSFLKDDVLMFAMF